MTSAGSLYRGEVMHRRVRPRVHAFRYRLFWILLDIDRLGEAAAKTRLFSIGRFNLLSFEPRDHGDGSSGSLREQALAKLDAAGIRDADGPIRPSVRAARIPIASVDVSKQALSLWRCKLVAERTLRTHPEF